MCKYIEVTSFMVAVIAKYTSIQLYLSKSLLKD